MGIGGRQRHAFAIATTFIVALLLASAPAHGDSAPQVAQWHRTLHPAQPGSALVVMLPLPNGTLLVRDGEGVVAIDERGVLRWSMPNVDDAILDGGTVIFRRSTFVFAARATDGGMVWKRPCAAPPYAAITGARIVTLCGGVSTILDAADGRVLARRETRIQEGPPHFRDARRLNDNYALVTNFFDGAWMGNTYYVVDSRTGAFLWGKTDFTVVDVTPTTIAITPYPSMLPWASAGYVERHRLADGKKVGSHQYALPVVGDAAERGNLATTSAATYITAFDGRVFRYPGNATSDPGGPVGNLPRARVVTLGATAFLFTDDGGYARNSGSLFIDRPSRNRGFETRRIGAFSGFVRGKSDPAGMPVDAPGAPIDGRMAVVDGETIRLYDQDGRERMAVATPRSDVHVAATRTMLFALCSGNGGPSELLGFRRP